jgi:hypothetical protein
MKSPSRRSCKAAALGLAAAAAITVGTVACSSGPSQSPEQAAITSAGCTVTQTLNHQQTLAQGGSSDASADGYLTTSAIGSCPNGDEIGAIGLTASGASFGPLVAGMASSAGPGVTGSYANGVVVVRGPASSFSG